MNGEEGAVTPWAGPGAGGLTAGVHEGAVTVLRLLPLTPPPSVAAGVGKAGLGGSKKELST